MRARKRLFLVVFDVEILCQFNDQKILTLLICVSEYKSMGQKSELTQNMGFVHCVVIGCVRVTHKSSWCPSGSQIRSWKAWPPSGPGRGFLWWCTGERSSSSVSWPPAAAVCAADGDWFSVLCVPTGTSVTGPSSPAAVSRRSAGGAGGTLRTSIWWRP